MTNGVLPLLESAGIQREECFFTNVYMGLSAGDSNTGPSPGAKNREFKRRCESFLTEQIAIRQLATCSNPSECARRRRRLDGRVMRMIANENIAGTVVRESGAGIAELL